MEANSAPAPLPCRYGALKTLGEKKAAFNEYVQQRKKEEAEEARQRRIKVGKDTRLVGVGGGAGVVRVSGAQIVHGSCVGGASGLPRLACSATVLRPGGSAGAGASNAGGQVGQYTRPAARAVHACIRSRAYTLFLSNNQHEPSSYCSTSIPPPGLTSNPVFWLTEPPRAQPRPRTAGQGGLLRAAGRVRGAQGRLPAQVLKGARPAGAGGTLAGDHLLFAGFLVFRRQLSPGDVRVSLQSHGAQAGRLGALLARAAGSVPLPLRVLCILKHPARCIARPLP